MGQCRYQWSYLYGFVHPETGATLTWQEPMVNTETFSSVLAKFAKAVGAGVNKRIALVVDGAGWHWATDLQVPAGLHLVKLHAYSPELQPAERLWPPHPRGRGQPVVRDARRSVHDGGTALWPVA